MNLTGGLLLFSRTKAIAQPQTYHQELIDTFNDACVQDVARL
ncbi:MAG: hypothetical protein WA902_12035 [Thermosynechococcaceae cyanobacterium]